MEQSNCELVFYGKLVSGQCESEVKQNVAKLFKASAGQVERMFTGQRVVIRNKLDLETAKKYRQAMLSRGAECTVEIMGQPGVDALASAPSSSPSPESNLVPPVASADPLPATEHVQAASQSQAATSKSAEGTSSATGTASNIDNPSGLTIAGDKVDGILAGTDFSLDPVGSRLSEAPVIAEEVELQTLKGVSVLPPGSDLKDPEEQPPVSVPDTSHLSIKADDD